MPHRGHNNVLNGNESEFIQRLSIFMHQISSNHETTMNESSTLKRDISTKEIYIMHNNKLLHVSHSGDSHEDGVELEDFRALMTSDKPLIHPHHNSNQIISGNSSMNTSDSVIMADSSESMSSANKQVVRSNIDNQQNRNLLQPKVSVDIKDQEVIQEFDSDMHMRGTAGNSRANSPSSVKYELLVAPATVSISPMIRDS